MSVKVGSVVTLKSGGPKMTVQKISMFDWANVVWWQEEKEDYFGSHYCKAWFKPDALKVIS